MDEWGFVEGSSVINRYVSSLYEVASKKGIERKVAHELAQVKKCVTDYSDHEKLLKRVTFLSDDGGKLVNFIKSNVRMSSEVSNFLDLLRTNGRFSMILRMCDAYLAYLDRIDGKKVFHVTLAKKDSAYSADKLVDELQSVFGGQIECVTKFDPSIKDGFKLQYQSKVLDYSLKSKLRRLRIAMRRENYEN